MPGSRKEYRLVFLERTQGTSVKDMLAFMEKDRYLSEFLLYDLLAAKRKDGKFFFTNELMKQYANKPDLSMSTNVDDATVEYTDKKGNVLFKGNRCKIETAEITPNGTIKITKNIDGTELSVLKTGNKPDEILKQVLIVKDTEGKAIEQIEYVKSSIEGLYNVVKTNLITGEKAKISEAYIDEQGNKVIKQNLTSINGTRTQTIFVENPNGNSTYKYKIIDKDGNVLLDNTKTREVISDFEFVYKSNDSIFNVKFSEEQIEILNQQTGEKTHINLKSLLSDCTAEEKAEWK